MSRVVDMNRQSIGTPPIQLSPMAGSPPPFRHCNANGNVRARPVDVGAAMGGGGIVSPTE